MNMSPKDCEYEEVNEYDNDIEDNDDEVFLVQSKLSSSYVAQVSIDDSSKRLCAAIYRIPHLTLASIPSASPVFLPPWPARVAILSD